MQYTIIKYNVDGVKYYKGFVNFLWFNIPITRKYIYKEEVKEKLKIT
jgi:hypothetical protein